MYLVNLLNIQEQRRFLKNYCIFPVKSLDPCPNTGIPDTEAMRYQSILEEESFLIITMYLLALYPGAEENMFKELMCFHYIIMETHPNTKTPDPGARMMNLTFIGRDTLLVTL